MSERRCRQVVNRFGFPLPAGFQCPQGARTDIGDYHNKSHHRCAEGDFDIQRQCLQHQPLYAAPVADTTPEVCSVDGYRKDHVLHRKGPCPFVPPQPAADAHRHNTVFALGTINRPAGIEYGAIYAYCTGCPRVFSSADIIALLNDSGVRP